MEITPFIDKQLDTPIYLQIYHYFREEIERGRLSEGKKIPSIRQLSQQVNVSRNTVEIAYQQLVAEGYLESREKRGLFVLALEELPTGHNEVAQPENTLTNHPISNPKIIDFQYGDIELDRFPLRIWKKCLVQAIETPTQEVFSYGDKKGHPGLRSEISTYLYQARGVNCSPNQIILTAGTQSAIHLLIQILSLSNRKVAIENPGYDGARFVFDSQRCEVIPISLEEDGIHLEELEESHAKCVYVTPSHQFPIGMILPIQKRMKLLQWAQRNQSYIIEDDYDGEFRYIGQPVPSLKSLDMNENVIYLGTFSKAFLPAARVSYIVLPKSLVSRFEKELFFYNQTVSPVIQEALYHFMVEGHFSRHIRKMRKIYQGKHKVLLSAIERFLGEKVEVIGQKAGLHLLLNFKDTDSRDLVNEAEAAGVRVYLTERFWYKNSSQASHPIMIGFGGVSEEKIHRGIQILAKTTKGL